MTEQSAKIVPRDYHDVITRVAAVKDVDVTKLEQLMRIQEQWEIRQAETHWNDQMALAQGAMDQISKDSANPMTQSRYASLEALDEAIRPIYTRHGFSVTFNDETPDERDKDGWLRLVAYVSNGAFTRKFTKWLPVSTSGLRGRAALTPTHASIAAVTYGRRALLKMIWNLAEVDNDGNTAWPKKMEAAQTGPVDEEEKAARDEFNAIEGDAGRADYLIAGMREQMSHSDLYVYGQKRRPLFVRLAQAERDRVDKHYKEMMEGFAKAQDEAQS